MSDPILEVKHVSKQYAAHKALSDVSLSVPSGCIYGLLGPNGAGKTSLIRIITQITAPDEGEILFKGEALKPEHISQIGYLPEERGLYKKMEVGEQLLYFARLKGLSRAAAMGKLKYWVERFDIKSWWKKKVEELSKGMQQKIQFIATVLHDPELIILDEPFSGFDPINVGIITEEILALKAKGTSIIFSTHRMESVEQLCDHIALINRSRKLLEGPVKQVRQQFRQNLYELTYAGPAITSTSEFEVIDTHRLDSSTSHTRVRLQKGVSANQLLNAVLNSVEIQSFSEHLPGMQEIFVKVVNDEEAVSGPTTYAKSAGRQA